MQATSITTCLASLLAAAMAPACTLDTLIPPQDMPVSENGVYTDSGRFFVVGNQTLYEVTGGPDDFVATPVLEGACPYMGGVTDDGEDLFIACSDLQGVLPSELLLVTPGAPATPDDVAVRRAAIPPAGGPLLLNGMEMGPDGALYVSNSGAALTGDAGVYRIRVATRDPLAITVEPFIDASPLSTLVGQGIGLAPNGLHFLDDDLYFVRGESIVRTRLRPDGSHGPLREVYAPGGLTVIDDFDIAAGRLFIAQQSLLEILAALFGNESGGEIVVTDRDGDVKGRQRVPFVPSSTAARANTQFGRLSLVVTSYFNGGLYRLTPTR